MKMIMNCDDDGDGDDCDDDYYHYDDDGADGPKQPYDYVHIDR